MIVVRSQGHVRPAQTRVRSRNPRDHVGESLLPASVPIFEDLGVREAIEAAGFLKKTGAVMVWTLPFRYVKGRRELVEPDPGAALL